MGEGGADRVGGVDGSVGKRQRHSDMIALSDDEVVRLSKERGLSRAERRRYIAEAKWRRRRNRRKRG